MFPWWNLVFSAENGNTVEYPRRNRANGLLNILQPTITPVNCDEYELQCARVWLLCLLYSGPACNQTRTGSFHSAISGGVSDPGGGEKMDRIGWGGGKAPKHVSTASVCVSSYRGSFPLIFTHTVSQISLTHYAEGYMKVGEEREGGLRLWGQRE